MVKGCQLFPKDDATVCRDWALAILNEPPKSRPGAWRGVRKSKLACVRAAFAKLDAECEEAARMYAIGQRPPVRNNLRRCVHARASTMMLYDPDKKKVSWNANTHIFNDGNAILTKPVRRRVLT